PTAAGSAGGGGWGGHGRASTRTAAVTSFLPGGSQGLSAGTVRLLSRGRGGAEDLIDSPRERLARDSRMVPRHRARPRRRDRALRAAACNAFPERRLRVPRAGRHAIARALAHAS